MRWVSTTLLSSCPASWGSVRPPPAPSLAEHSLGWQNPSSLPGPLLFPSSLPPCCLNLPHRPSATSAPNRAPQTPSSCPLHPFPPAPHPASRSPAHLAPRLWAVLLWPALTSPLLGGHSKETAVLLLRRGTGGVPDLSRAESKPWWGF